jgi:phosphoserine phosphatase
VLNRLATRNDPARVHRTKFGSLTCELKISEEKDANELAAWCAASDSRPDIRLLVLDIDGTIVRESNRTQESVTQAIHSVQRWGVEVALATGRLYRSSLHANDVEMLEYAGIGVAMGNAPEAVRAISGWVAPTVQADGVVKAIQTWILQEY